ncbi:MAG: peptidoglycan-binding protein [Gaiellaceae bacterium]
MTDELGTAGDLTATGARYRRRSRTRRRPRRLAWPLIALLLIGALAAAVVWLLSERSNSPSTSVSESVPVETATVELMRRDLVETERLDGTLEFTTSSTLTSSVAGTLTAVVAEESLLERGTELFRVDNRPVIAMIGSTPAYRTLERGIAAGPDIFQLEFNLVELGFDPDGELLLDEKFNKKTEAAVKRWQESLGVKDDGIVSLGDVIFLTGENRVSRQLVDLGTSVQPGAPVVELSDVEQVITVALEANRQELVAEQDRVVIELPDEQQIAGVVTEIGRTATAQVLSDGTRTDAVVPITVTPTEPVPGDLVNAPVDVLVTKRALEGTLAAPVTALVALRDGGYAVEIVDGEQTRLVGVEPGVFADGFVEISGADVREGMRVVVPK